MCNISMPLCLILKILTKMTSIVRHEFIVLSQTIICLMIRNTFSSVYPSISGYLFKAGVCRNVNLMSTNLSQVLNVVRCITFQRTNLNVISSGQ